MLVQTKSGNKLTGFFRGTVLKRCSMGKCKVFIYGVYPDELKNDPSKLPDCEQAAPLFGGILNGNGMFSYPNIGATVWCFFANEDQNHPVYFASTLGDATKSGDNFARIEQQQAEDTGAYLHRIQCGESTITISEVGNVIIETNHYDVANSIQNKSTIVVNQGGGVEINTSDQVKISTQATTIVSGKKLELDSDVIKIKAKSRLTVSSPRMSFDAINDADSNPSVISQTGANSIRFHSDAINLEAENGNINYKCLTNFQGNL